MIWDDIQIYMIQNIFIHVYYHIYNILLFFIIHILNEITYNIYIGTQTSVTQINSVSNLPSFQQLPQALELVRSKVVALDQIGLEICTLQDFNMQIHCWEQVFVQEPGELGQFLLEILHLVIGRSHSVGLLLQPVKQRFRLNQFVNNMILTLRCQLHQRKGTSSNNRKIHRGKGELCHDLPASLRNVVLRYDMLGCLLHSAPPSPEQREPHFQTKKLLITSFLKRQVILVRVIGVIGVMSHSLIDWYLGAVNNYIII